MIKKIFLCVTMLFLFSATADAKHNWVWTGNGIEVYLEDATIEISDDKKEFSVTVIDKVIGKKNFHLSRFNFYRQNESWFYNITGKGIVIPVTHTNASGYILDFVEKLFPPDTETDSEIVESEGLNVTAN